MKTGSSYLDVIVRFNSHLSIVTLKDVVIEIKQNFVQKIDIENEKRLINLIYPTERKKTQN